MKVFSVFITGALVVTTITAESIPLTTGNQPVAFLQNMTAPAPLVGKTSRILVLGGREVPEGQKTWMVGLRTTSRGANYCGGTLISPTHELTAAHCASPKFVSVGSHYVEGSIDGDRIPVSRMIRHPGYVSSTNTFDVAIVELAWATSFPPLMIQTTPPPTGATATVTGWGQTSVDGAQSLALLSTEVPIWPNDKCAQQLPIDSTMLCAGGQYQTGSCVGDSGGPLTIQRGASDVLVGVVSWGKSCGLVNYPSVFARVSTVLPWINTVTDSRCGALDNAVCDSTFFCTWNGLARQCQRWWN